MSPPEPDPGPSGGDGTPSGRRPEGPASRATLTRAGEVEPQRTCVGCRRRSNRSVLLRVVADEVDGHWYVDPDLRRRRAGRGAWLHEDAGCLRAAERRSAFSRALRRSGPMDVTRLRKYLGTLDVAEVEPQ